MLLPKYQRFVAWRYLMERHRRISGGVAVVVQVCFWLALGMGAACLWFPLSDIKRVPPPNPPQLLIVLVGLSTVLPIAALVTAILRKAAGRSPLGWLLCSVHWGLLALAVLALYRHGMGRDGWSRDELGAGLVFYLFGAFILPMIARVLLAWHRGLPASSGAFVITLLFSPIPAIIWVLIKLRVVSPRWWQAIAVLLSLRVVSVQVSLLGAAYFGIRSLAWPVLLGGDTLPKNAILIGLAITISLAALTKALYARLRKRPAQLWVELGVFAMSVAIAAVIVALFLYGVAEVAENLKFFGGWSSYTPPMGLIMPAIVAAAIAILALVLLVVRYFFTFFTTVSIGGVTIGTMALVIVLSVMSGFETDLREKILGFNAHIQVSKTDELQFEDYDKVEAVLASMPSVVGYTPFLITEAYMSNHNNYGNVTLKGIDPDRVASVTEIVHNLEKGDERALAKIWPLAADGTVLGAPLPHKDGDTGVVDGLDIDLGDIPIDFSGGLDRVPDQADEDELDLGLDLGLPTDFSGGLETYEESDAGVATADDDGFDESNDNPGAGLEHFEDWDMEEVPIDYVSPDVAVLDGVLVGRELANQIQLYTAQEVRVISPLPDVSPDGLSIPRMKNFRIAGRFFSGMYEYDLKYVYCSLSSLQDFLDLGDVVNGIEVRVRDPRDTGVIVKQLEAALGPDYKVQDWKELNKALFSALKLEKIAMFFILVIIVLVASFSIVGNLIMVVIEKAKEIAILKTLGSSDSGVMKIFVTQGFFIGLVGTSLGVALGLGASYLGKTLGVPLDPDVYYIDKLPIQVELASVAAVGLAGLIISVVATLYPAYLAARMRPVKGLRWNS